MQGIRMPEAGGRSHFDYQWVPSVYYTAAPTSLLKLWQRLAASTIRRLVFSLVFSCPPQKNCRKLEENDREAIAKSRQLTVGSCGQPWAVAGVIRPIIKPSKILKILFASCRFVVYI